MVIVGGLLTVDFLRLLSTDPGFETGRVLVTVIIPAGDRYQTPASRDLLFRKIVGSVRALPGVESAGTVDAMPFSGVNNGGTIGTEIVTGGPGTGDLAEIDGVSAGYLEAMDIPLLEGRRFTEDDLSPDRDAAIINDVARKPVVAPRERRSARDSA